jgi:hypothetical protein
LAYNIRALKQNKAKTIRMSDADVGKGRYLKYGNGGDHYINKTKTKTNKCN